MIAPVSENIIIGPFPELSTRHPACFRGSVPVIPVILALIQFHPCSVQNGQFIVRICLKDRR